MQKAWETYQQAKNEIYILFPIEFLTTKRFENSVGGGSYLFQTVELTFKVDWERKENRQLSEVS